MSSQLLVQIFWATVCSQSSGPDCASVSDWNQWCCILLSACREQGRQCLDHVVKASHLCWPELRLGDVWDILQ